jgi:uncharacterized Fe-S center protein
MFNMGTTVRDYTASCPGAIIVDCLAADPVASDQACVDLVYAAPDGKDLIQRMESRHGIHTLEHGEAIGLGSRNYSLVTP